MGCNVGKGDQIFRFVLGVVLLLAYFLGWIAGTWGTVALIVGIILVVTAAFRFCPLYRLLGVSTCEPQKG
ncbi:YgaP family membrane protein [Oceanithermus sp.]